ncbi:unnamed protein product [Oreochromis niloticus]|nr:unnamed protein product [Mustela putorius furo]
MFLMVVLVLLGTGLSVNSAPPEVSLYAKTSRVDTDVVLTCLATGFYPADIVLRMKKNESVLTADDGLTSSGVLPNEDHTFQRRDHVEVLRSDLSAFSCEAVHEASAVSVTRVWDSQSSSDSASDSASDSGVSSDDSDSRGPGSGRLLLEPVQLMF